jgi:hypothetical protein
MGRSTTRRSVPGALAATAQTVYGLIGVGGATAVLMLLSGLLYARFGPAGFWAMALAQTAAASLGNSTMTNATVAHMVKGVEGDEINLQYKDGEKKIVVTPNTTIVTYVPGDKSEVKPGAKIFIAASSKKEDGTLEAPTISVGRDGITPPM